MTTASWPHSAASRFRTTAPWPQLTVSRFRRPVRSPVPGEGCDGDDGGSAVVEFLVLGLLMLVPLVYLVIAMGRVQAASFAADGSAREAARAYVTAAGAAEGERRAAAAVRLGLLDQGFDDVPPDTLRLRCDATPCLSPGRRIVAEVEVDVVLPGIPAFLDRAVPLRVIVRSAHVAVVDEFRTVGGS